MTSNTDQLAAAIASGDPRRAAVAIERLISWSITAATGKVMPEPTVQRSQTHRTYL